ncbi:DNA-directed RNA polymerase III subunit Rpc5 [Dichotomocladium elegans]|nr:DNA-directed RNA polymerase III subunit Rpc5 [Dichotomocladium elegans]
MASVLNSDLIDVPAANHEAQYNSDDDEVLGEIPVYLTTALAKYMYIFQYPMRNMRFSSRNGPQAARMKPQANMVELDIPLDTRSEFYSTERGEDFAMGMNEKAFKTAYDKRMEEMEEENMYGRSSTAAAGSKKEEELLDRMTLSSTEVPSQTNYVVGAVRDGGLHLTPVRSIIQMRPAFKYIDKIDEKFKAANKRIQDAEKEEAATKPDPSTSKAQALQVTVKNSEKETTARRNAYSMAVRNAEEEPWQPIVYYDDSTHQAEIIYEALFTHKTQPLKSAMTRSQYLNELSGIKQ